MDDVSVIEVDLGIYHMIFDGDVSWERFYHYYVRLEEMSPPDKFVVIATFGTSKIPIIDTGIVKYASLLKEVGIKITDAITTDVSLEQVTFWRTVMKVIPGLTEQLHYADGFDEAVKKAHQILEASDE